MGPHGVILHTTMAEQKRAANTRIGIIYCANDSHSYSGHPERPERVNDVKKFLTARFPEITVFEMEKYSHREVLEFILRDGAYSQEHLELIKIPFAQKNSAYSVGENSYLACLDVCRCLMTMCNLVEKGTIDYAINVVRPPGHHCCNMQPAGFCLLNSAVLATNRLLKTFRKIPIYDFDLHHGGGTQKATYHNPDIMYVSQHNDLVWRDTFEIGEACET